jgi:hypothetical protein
VGKKIIESCLDNGTVEEYETLLGRDVAVPF